MIKKSVLFFLCFTLFLSIPGCKKKLPTSPDIPAIVDPTVQSITVVSNSDLLYIGVSETFTATATLSDGSSKTVVGGTWSGNNSSVATVGASTGEVTIVGSGMVDVSVSYEGQQGSKSIRGLPNYQGTWAGEYIFTSCSATGDMLIIDFCDVVGDLLGPFLPIELNLIQSDDRVEGHVLFGGMSTETNGPIQTDGQVLLTGAMQEVIEEGAVTIEIAMLFQSAVPGQITGHLSHHWRVTGLSGVGQLEGDILELSRISTMAMSLRRVPRMVSPTIKDLVRALRRH